MTLSLVFNPFAGAFDYVDIASGFAAYTPTVIAAGATYTIPALTQLLYQHPIQIDGVLHNDGILAAVN